MGFEKWFEQYAPTAPEVLDECALAAYRAALDDAIETAKRCRPEDTVQALCRLRDKTPVATSTDAITAYYTDGANSGQAALTAHR